MEFIPNNNVSEAEFMHLTQCNSALESL